MKIVIAPDSFKESLSSQEVCHAIAKGIKKVFPKAEILLVPMADGGEGSLEALKHSCPTQRVSVLVHDPILRKRTAAYGITQDKTGLIEMAKASGLELLSIKERNPWVTSSFGTGELIRHALEKGCKKIVLLLGGVSTNDAGVGMAQALGYTFLDRRGKKIPPGVGGLKNLHSINISNAHPILKKVNFFAATDVTNPLCGPFGSAMVYGAQKGATPSMIPKMEACLRHFAKIADRDLNNLRDRPRRDLSLIPGGGAAGGTGAGALAFLDATFISGVEWIIQATRLEEKVKGAALIITGEGKIDSQTLFGKTVLGVARVGKKQGVPTIAFCGQSELIPKKLYSQGLSAVFPIVRKPSTYAECLKDASIHLEETGEQVLRLLHSFL